MDTGALGQVAAALMESLDTQEMADVEIGEVMVLAELRFPADEEDPDGCVTIAFRCSDPRAWIQDGMLHAALDGNRETD